MNEILEQRISSVQIGKNITHTNIVAKRSLREQLDRDLEDFLANGREVEVLPRGFSHFKNGIIPQGAANAIRSEQDRIDREKAIEAKNQEIRDYKAALKEKRRVEAKQKFKSQTDEQIRVLGEFVRKSSGNKQDFERLAEMAGYRPRHLRDAAKGHSKLADEKWALVKQLIKKFEFGGAV